MYFLVPLSLSPSPPIPLPSGCHQSVICIYDSVSILFVYSVFLIPCISEIIWYLSFSDLFHLAEYPLGSSMLLQKVRFHSFLVWKPALNHWATQWRRFHSFLWLSSISLYICTMLFYSSFSPYTMASQVPLPSSVSMFPSVSSHIALDIIFITCGPSASYFTVFYTVTHWI